VSNNFTELEPQRDLVGDSFSGYIRQRNNRGLVITNIASEAQIVKRTAKAISRSNIDSLYLLLQREGESYIEQDGRAIRLNKGDYALVDPSETYCLTFDDKFEQLCLNIPRSTLFARINNPKHLTAVKPTVGEQLSQLTLHYMESLQQPNLAENPAMYQQLVNGFLELLSVTFNESEYIGEATTNSSSASVQLDMLLNYIQKNLSDPKLSPNKAAEELGISLRYVHKLFNLSDATFGRRVLKERLTKCATDLRNPNLATKSIAEIAFSWGFNDLSHFGRSFKKLYDITPRQWRKHSSEFIAPP